MQRFKITFRGEITERKEGETFIKANSEEEARDIFFDNIPDDGFDYDIANIESYKEFNPTEELTVIEQALESLKNKDLARVGDMEILEDLKNKLDALFIKKEMDNIPF